MDILITDTASNTCTRTSCKLKKALCRHLSVFVMILFVLPFAGSMYLFTARINHDIRFTETELLGLRVHQALFELMLTTEQIRGFLYENNQSGIINSNSKVALLKNKIQLLIDKVDALDREMDAVGVLNEWEEAKSKLLMAIG